MWKLLYNLFCRAFMPLGIIPLLIGAAAGAGTGYLASQKKVTKDPYGQLNPEQVAIAKALGPYYQNTLASGPQSYTGDYTAPMSDLEQENLANYSRLNAIRNNSLTEAMSVDPQSYNTEFNQYVADPTLDYAQRRTLPLIQEQYPGFSSSGANAMGQSLADIQGKLSQQRWQGLLDRRAQAIQASGALDTGATTSAQLFSIPRSITQLGLDKQYTDYVNANKQYQTSIDSMLAFLGLSTRTQETEYPYAGAVSGAMAGANMGLNYDTAQQQNQSSADWLTAYKKANGIA
jgi:hypothetical protein